MPVMQSPKSMYSSAIYSHSIPVARYYIRVDWKRPSWRHDRERNIMHMWNVQWWWNFLMGKTDSFVSCSRLVVLCSIDITIACLLFRLSFTTFFIWFWDTFQPLYNFRDLFACTSFAGIVAISYRSVSVSVSVESASKKFWAAHQFSTSPIKFTVIPRTYDMMDLIFFRIFLLVPSSIISFTKCSGICFKRCGSK